MSKEEFVSEAKKVHGDKYDYKSILEESKLEAYNNVPIICPKHGVFYQSVYHHLQGTGCFKCEIEKENDR